MRLLLSRVPLFIYAVLAGAGVFLAVRSVGLPSQQIEAMAISASLAWFALILVAVQIQLQRRNNRISTEYLNRPEFKIVGWQADVLAEEYPRRCPEFNNCKDVHWLDVIQTGRIPARNVKLCLLHKTEDHDIKRPARWKERTLVTQDERFQYHLRPTEIPFTLVGAEKNRLFLLIQYSSAYSSILYKQIHCISYLPYPLEDADPRDWINRSMYLSSHVAYAYDSQTIPTRLVLKGRWFALLHALGIRRNQSDEDWVIRF